jgi:hypothetical protein
MFKRYLYHLVPIIVCDSVILLIFVTLFCSLSTQPGITMIVASGDNGNSAVGSYCDFVSDVVGTSEWVPPLETLTTCNADVRNQP